MGSWLLWGLAAAFAVAAFTDLGQGAESGDATGEAEGEPSKGGLGILRLPRTTRYQRHKPMIYRTGSLSVLSRGLMKNLSALQDESEEDIPHHEREDRSIGDHCQGCCGTPFPNHTGSREPSKGDSGHLGHTTTAEPPRINVTKRPHYPGIYTPIRKLELPYRPVGEGQQPSKGDSGQLGHTTAAELPRINATKRPHYPGIYTPMRKLEPPYRPVGEGQAGSNSGTKGMGHQDAHASQDRCRGCCGANTGAGAELPGRREEGNASQGFGGSLSKGVWRPVSDSSKVPGKQPSQSGGNGRFPFSRGAVDPSQHRRGQ
ncbi:uncharacterized protein LOC134395831 isoform X3 [Elgaria multicarinata webbii]|uniref:uncharacterized protein LOC134395831 isoform X3 n=1 Tax=Elgaria multicarinata webbii TaxID=159646 RepID=UPI002FCD6547